MMKWSSFSLNPRAPDVAETTGYKDADGGSGSAGPVDEGFHPAAADLQHELADHILNVSSNLDESEQLVDVPPSEVGADEGRWDTNHLPAHWFSWKKLWRFTGPGFLMSIAYIDPGNLEGDLQAGANTGYILLWVLVWSTVMGGALQLLAAKLGVATGQHLAEHCRAEYPRAPRLLMWIMIEIAIIGCDIQEVIGSAIAIFLLSKGAIPLYAGVIITAVDSFLLLLIDRIGVRHLEAMFGILVGVMAVAFGVMFADAGADLGQVLEGIAVPRMTRSSVHYAVAIVGAIIMPHNIYLHSALVQSRDINRAQVARKKEAIAYFSIESALALLISLFINLCVVSVFAKGFYGKEAGDIGLKNAGDYLGERFGSHMTFIWALGLLAAGQTSTMTGTYSGQFVMGGFLNLKVSKWKRIAITRSAAIGPTLLVALAFRNQDTKLDSLNEWINVLQSVQLPFALIPVLAMTSSERIMGPEFVNHWITRAVGWVIAAGILAINASDVYEFASSEVAGRSWMMVLLIVAVMLYLSFVLYLTIGPDRVQRWRASQSKQRQQDATDGHLRAPLLAHG
ncbi:hypothetical protein ABBQ32_010741 [Trebouxia sp. C0010 RCD-2024]